MRYAIQHTPVRHSASLFAYAVEFRVCQPTRFSRTRLAEALAYAVDRLRVVEAAFSRRHAGNPRYAAVTAAVMAGCRRVRQRTGGYFDPWAMPGGFDPGGLLTGWALERAAAALTDAGIVSFAITSGDELLVRGTAPDGQLWRIGVRHPTRELGVTITDAGISTSVGGVVDPHTQQPTDHWGAVTVLGPDLGVADAYATALRAAGPAGLAWFPTPDGYHTVLLTEPGPGEFADEPTGDLTAA